MSNQNCPPGGSLGNLNFDMISLILICFHRFHVFFHVFIHFHTNSLKQTLNVLKTTKSNETQAKSYKKTRMFNILKNISKSCSGGYTWILHSQILQKHVISVRLQTRLPASSGESRGVPGDQAAKRYTCAVRISWLAWPTRTWPGGARTGRKASAGPGRKIKVLLKTSVFSHRS